MTVSTDLTPMHGKRTHSYKDLPNLVQNLKQIKYKSEEIGLKMTPVNYGI